MPPSLVGGLPDWGLLVLRIMMGVVFIAHGWPKVNPQSRIGGIPGWMQAMVRMRIPFPAFFGVAVPLSEFVGGIMMILGLGVRVVAFLQLCIMIVAILRAKIPRGVKFTENDKTGWEFDFLLGATALALILMGAGMVALDPIVGL